jgi:chemotaxis protein MotC
VDRTRLPERDVPLVNAAIQLALDVRKSFGGSAAATASDTPPATPARLDLSTSTASLARARQQLRDLEVITKDRRP